MSFGFMSKLRDLVTASKEENLFMQTLLFLFIIILRRRALTWLNIIQNTPLDTDFVLKIYGKQNKDFSLSSCYPW